MLGGRQMELCGGGQVGGSQKQQILGWEDGKTWLILQTSLALALKAIEGSDESRRIGLPEVTLLVSSNHGPPGSFRSWSPMLPHPSQLLQHSEVGPLCPMSARLWIPRPLRRTMLCHCRFFSAISETGLQRARCWRLAEVGRAACRGCMSPAHSFEETPGSIPQASPHRAGCESGRLTNYSLKPKSFSNPGDYEQPSEALLGRASGRTWKVFTFVEGPVSVKDDRASASENQVCMRFFSPRKHSNF